ncbi:MAG TPA: bifunctional UDP-sugar hydrolase/5'-nucleotidase [Longimicrobiaceae bacterium]|jgi:2',3'-cyclic-nucleotide 2'-phosphodiesterase (5'-nucleotidase family)|nr:bifunctional UDP-sugar hydrolase/5'-nucleotidase [Longimicrobiaceae bacterium]
MTHLRHAVRISIARPLSLALAALLFGGCTALPSPEAAPQASADGAKRVQILQTNDVHGHLLPWNRVGGSALLAAYFDSARVRFAGSTVLISGGDDMQGTPISNLSWGRAAIAAENAMGYDAAAVGNHEFDWGQDTLRARIRESRFPWLAANLFVAGTQRQPEWVRPWTMVERGGVRTAVIGIALPETPETVMAGRVDGLEFGPAAPAIDRYAAEARVAGADFVVVTMHVGGICERPGTLPEQESAGCTGEVLEVARQLARPVDLMLAGHRHERMLTWEKGIPVVESISYANAFSITQLERRGGHTSVLYRAIRTPSADSATPNAAVERIVSDWDRAIRPITERVLVSFAVPMPKADTGEFALGDLMADAFRARTGAQASIVNNGSIRQDMPAGPLTYGTLFQLQPFQNALVRVGVTGEQLRRALEAGLTAEGGVNAHVSGLTVAYAPRAPQGSRIRAIRLADGRTVTDADHVTLGLSEFVASGGDRFVSLREGRATSTGLVDLDALIAYLQTLPQPVTPPTGRRWIAVP